METSAYIAASQFNNVEFGQILCSGDSLAGEEWDKREYRKRRKYEKLCTGLCEK